MLGNAADRKTKVRGFGDKIGKIKTNKLRTWRLVKGKQRSETEIIMKLF